MQGNGEILSDDFAQLMNSNTREVLRIRPGMFGGEKMQHIGYSPTARWSLSPGGMGSGRCSVTPPTSGAFCARPISPKSWNGGVQRSVPGSAHLSAAQGHGAKNHSQKDSLTILGSVFTPPFTLSQLAEKLGARPHCAAKRDAEKPNYRPRESLYPGPCFVGRAWTTGLVG